MENILYWVVSVQAIALAALFWLTQYQRERQDQIFHQMQADLRAAITATRAALSDYKLEVAQRYASIGYLKDVETRLTEHVLRIESKITVSPHTGKSE